MDISKIKSELQIAEKTYDISSFTVKTILSSPIIIVFIISLLLIFPATRASTLWIIEREEDQPVELLTFAFLARGGILWLVLAWQLRKHGEEWFTFGFFGIFSIGLLFVAMEEIAWGQWFFGFETPPGLKAINAQGEVTFHNIQGLQGHSEFFRIAFGLGGMVGVWFSYRQLLPTISPPTILFLWFLVISILAGLDLYEDYFSFQNSFDAFVRSFSEVVEMMIAISGLLYVWLKARELLRTQK